MTLLRKSLLLASASVLCGSATSGLAYNFTTIEVPGAASSQTNAFGINESGVVAGTYRDGTTTRGFTFTNGAYSTVNVGSSSTFLRAINDAGTMAGAARISSTRRDGFSLPSSGTPDLFQVLDPAGFTLPYAINNAGAIAGGSVLGSAGQQGFVRVGAVVTSFAVPGASNTYPYAINNAGVIAGTFNPLAGGAGSFVRSTAGDITILNIAGLDEPTVFGINDSGLLVGAANEVDGFIFDGSTATIVNFPGASRTTITDINNNNTIVGIYELGGVTRSFVAVVPEPASLSLLAGAGVLTLRRRK